MGHSQTASSSNIKMNHAINVQSSISIGVSINLVVEGTLQSNVQTPPHKWIHPECKWSVAAPTALPLTSTSGGRSDLAQISTSVCKDDVEIIFDSRTDLPPEV